MYRPLLSLLILALTIAPILAHTQEYVAYPINTPPEAPALSTLEREGVHVACPKCSSTPECARLVGNRSLIVVAIDGAAVAVVDPYTSILSLNPSYTSTEEIPYFTRNGTIMVDRGPYDRYVECVTTVVDCTPRVSVDEKIWVASVIVVAILIPVLIEFLPRALSSKADSVNLVS